MGPEISINRPKLAARIAGGHSIFNFPLLVRKIISTKNAIESLTRVTRKTTKIRVSFPTDNVATKLIYLEFRSFKKTGRAAREWDAAGNQFAILHPERINK